ncbi:insulinase family protein [Palleronia sediminis]|uniref:Insulinase family protein n=1 Tax=Palleronia sediminis TaxID=2547833 RepID=A0A4R6A266_9RHOB|nr:pitrilysin family protein [Palleronia sediminis]TDL76018.1 insulinase family protein [Palleronia sediminis]
MIRLLLVCLLGLAALPARAAVEVEQITSPGGIDAWLVEDHSLPFVALELRFRGGAALDRPGRAGAVNLMTGLLEEGTGDLDAQGFAGARDALAASYDFDAGNDSVSVSARWLSETQDEAVSLLRRALVEPAFTEDSIDRVRDQVLSGLARDATDPGAIARRSFDAMAFPDHPYGTPVEGMVASVGGLTRDDIVQAHADTLVRDRAYIAATGDITADELGRVLDTLLGDLPATSPADLPGAAEWSLDPGISVIDYAVPQSVILFGHEGIARDDPDFFAAYILNEIVGGGGFNSRLMEEVRVKRGLTYGVGSYLLPLDHAAMLMGQASSANDSAAEAVEVIADEWARAAEGVTEDELEAAKRYLTGAYPLRFDGNARIAGILVGMQLDGLPADYIETRNDEIEAVTLEDIRRVAERIFRPEDLSFVVVGQPEGLSSTN